MLAVLAPSKEVQGSVRPKIPIYYGPEHGFHMRRKVLRQKCRNFMQVPWTLYTCSVPTGHDSCLDCKYGESRGPAVGTQDNSLEILGGSHL